MTMKLIGKSETPYGSVEIHVGRYSFGGAIYVELLSAEEECYHEPVATFSTNLLSYGARHDHNEFCVKCWSENEPLVQPMMATGLFEDTGRRVMSGFAEAQIWRITDSAHVP